MPDLKEMYIQAMNEQRNYLLTMQNSFNQRCEEITSQAQEKLAKIPETDPESRKLVAEEQKKLLEEALAQLKNEINNSSSKSRARLEEIFTQIESSKLAELEKSIKNI